MKPVNAKSESFSPAAGDPGPGQENRRTILVVDDDKFVLEAIEAMLHSIGFDSISTSDGSDAITLAEGGFITNANCRIDGMILDLTIRSGSGSIEIIQKIRKIDPLFPVIVTSGFPDSPVMQDPGTFGFSASLVKPFGKAKLEELLKKQVNCQKEENL